MKLTSSLRCFVLAASLSVLGASGAVAARLSDDDMIRFLTQGICLDAIGRPTSQVPVVDNCARVRPQVDTDREVYQKHDWPDMQMYPRHYVVGHQASDSVLVSGVGRPVVEQTLDFGGDPYRQFGRFDREDGGNVVLLANGWASIVMTQDLNSGVAWFIGAGCEHSRQDAAVSWLLFNDDVPTGSWAEGVAHLTNSHSPFFCPRRFAVGLTRFRRERIQFPFRVVQGEKVRMAKFQVDVIISDRFGGANSIAGSRGLERFYHARDLGMIRWERWENLAVHTDSHFATRARDVIASRRCPEVEYSTSPGPTWTRVGCRTWTTIVRPNEPWTVKDYHWRALEDFNWTSGF